MVMQIINNYFLFLSFYIVIALTYVTSADSIVFLTYICEKINLLKSTRAYVEFFVRGGDIKSDLLFDQRAIDS